MRLRVEPMWRSWIAALCVALIAFAALEVVSPAHAADIYDTASVSVISDGAEATNAASDGAPNENGSPIEQPQQRHCCGAHASSMAPLVQASAPLQLTESLTPVHGNDAARDRAPQGLERPPRAIAIV